MPAVLTRRPYRAQPQQWAAASKYWLSRGLRILALPWSPLDVAAGLPVTRAGATLDYGTHGAQWNFSGSTTDHVSIPTDLFIRPPAWTVVAVVRSTGNASDSQVVANVNYDGSTVPLMLCIGGGHGVFEGVGVFDAGWFQSGIGGYDIRGDGKWHVVLGSFLDGIGMVYAVDGKIRAASGAINLVNTNSSGALTIGAYLDFPDLFTGNIAMVGVFDQAFHLPMGSPEGEIAALTTSVADFCGLWEPRQARRVYFLTGPPQYAYPVADITTDGWLPFPGAVPETVRNLLTYTEDLSNAAYTPVSASVTADTTTDPLGGSSADKLVEASSGSTQHYITRDVSMTASADYTFSRYCKPAGRSVTQLRITALDGNVGFAKFDLMAGTVAAPGYMSTGGLPGSAAISAEANGFYRCSVTVNAATGGGTPSIQWNLCGATSNTIYSGNGTSGTYSWGAQFEAGTLTAYQPIIATTPPLGPEPPLWQTMDEDAPADPADYAYSPDGPTTEEFEVELSAVGSPGHGEDLVADYQFQAIGLDTDFRLTLLCGATLIDQWTDTVAVVDGAFTWSHTIAAADADMITDYGDLRLRGRAQAAAGGVGRVTWFRLKVPEAVTTPSGVKYRYFLA